MSCLRYPSASMIAVVLAVAGWTSQVWADGMVTYHTEVADAETVLVEASAQRAILWYRDGTWEITIQPQFARTNGAAAWVVPFPVVPTVKQASAELFDAMDKLTAPVFVPYCFEEEDDGGWFGGCGATAGKADGGLSRTGPAQSGVVVWGSGVTDDLEYVVISSPGSEALIQWLETEGFRVPKALKDNPVVVQGQYLFAGKIRGDVDPTKPLSPLTFELPGVKYEEVAYPMRLTALVAPEDGMELVLWLVAPKDLLALVPKSVDWLPYGGDMNATKTQWETDREKVRRAFPPKGGMVVEYTDQGSGGLANNPMYLDQIWLPVYSYEPVTAKTLGLDRPETWPEEVTEMATDNYGVIRLAGRLTAEAMATDLSFQKWGQALDPISNLYFEQLPCSELAGTDLGEVQASRTLGGLAILVAVFMLSAFAVVRGRRAR